MNNIGKGFVLKNASWLRFEHSLLLPVMLSDAELTGKHYSRKKGWISYEKPGLLFTHKLNGYLSCYFSLKTTESIRNFISEDIEQMICSNGTAVGEKFNLGLSPSRWHGGLYFVTADSNDKAVRLECTDKMRWIVARLQKKQIVKLEVGINIPLAMLQYG